MSRYARVPASSTSDRYASSPLRNYFQMKFYPQDIRIVNCFIAKCSVSLTVIINENFNDCERRIAYAASVGGTPAIYRLHNPRL